MLVDQMVVQKVESSVGKMVVWTVELKVELMVLTKAEMMADMKAYSLVLWKVASMVLMLVDMKDCF
jgi:hypothetical protein